MINDPKELFRQSQYGVWGVSYHTHDGVDAPKVSHSNLKDAPNYFCKSTTTNGTNSVNVFSIPVTYNLTITGVFITSLDTTAGNITLTNNGTTVCLIAKGTTSGAMVGATSLANTSYTAGNSLTLVSSSAGNAQVFITFKT